MKTKLIIRNFYHWIVVRTLIIIIMATIIKDPFYCILPTF